MSKKFQVKILPKKLLLSKLTNRPNMETDITVWSRNMVIPDFLINKFVKVYNGKDFKIIKITKEKIGFKFGEFVLTRKPYVYKGKKKIIKKIKK